MNDEFNLVERLNDDYVYASGREPPGPVASPVPDKVLVRVAGKPLPHRDEWVSNLRNASSPDKRVEFCIANERGWLYEAILMKYGIIRVWLEEHPSGMCSDMAVCVERSDGQKARLLPPLDSDDITDWEEYDV